ncbi:mini-chromosome maintenance replisome factor-domain-containing protein [Pavlovales sp. CCMP2436]|nr:mini-chromosome maintenance replisome factor-domain-containing protein [Pavlovales sp. CCMP2436]
MGTPTSSAADALARPLAIADACFVAAAADPARLASGHGWGLRAAIEQAIAAAGGLSAVPALDVTPLEQLRPGSLVRFQGMVQDTWDPEYFLGVYETRNDETGEIRVHSGKYVDVVEAPPGHTLLPLPRGPPSQRPGERTALFQRTPMLVVPTPAFSPWAADARSATCATPAVPMSTGSRPKRSGRDDDDDDESVTPSGGMDIDESANGAPKRAFAVNAVGGGNSDAAGAAGAGAMDAATGAGFRYAGLGAKGRPVSS